MYIVPQGCLAVSHSPLFLIMIATPVSHASLMHRSTLSRSHNVAGSCGAVLCIPAPAVPAVPAVVQYEKQVQLEANGPSQNVPVTVVTKQHTEVTLRTVTGVIAPIPSSTPLGPSVCTYESVHHKVLTGYAKSLAAPVLDNHGLLRGMLIAQNFHT
jgi:hypothetical protein